VSVSYRNLYRPLLKIVASGTEVGSVFDHKAGLSLIIFRCLFILRVTSCTLFFCSNGVL